MSSQKADDFLEANEQSLESIDVFIKLPRSAMSHFPILADDKNKQP